MEIRRAGSQVSSPCLADWFTGMACIDPLFSETEPARAAGSAVTFEPNARTAWHTHLVGQDPDRAVWAGWIHYEGRLAEEIKPGDVVWFAPEEKHWYGAAPRTTMTHIAIQEAQGGKGVDWPEHVTDAPYQTGQEA
ncbi:cupin domain-containing protein (plasmid) [Deinococcus sp. KNUC1210]|uniref:(R)-mandelonitrile lyase n=1 Tax=Deinococcus sp. KNUC1210 TaxID=2917691 RepID=UPI001EF0A4E5|nr:cupin domain-containing protein [Deinococcus sp. KNUC1210]ULH17947.1 cupin domain-containing protein [Deinococcus sp. KNUC1210]